MRSGSEGCGEVVYLAGEFGGVGIPTGNTAGCPYLLHLLLVNNMRLPVIWRFMMEIDELVSKDVWAIIKDNYEKGSYTIAITNMIQYANEIVREKSELSLDNTKLMDAAFLGQNPKLKINKLQTETEKDIQAGIGYLLKGLCLAVRNPRAHERYNDKRETADSIILFLNFILEFVRDSKQPALIDDWLEFVFDINFNNTKEYAELVLQALPEKKRYELLVNIFRYRERAKQNLLNNLVNKLMESIKAEELKEFLANLNKELLYSSDNKNLRMFLSLFPPEKWNLLIPLIKLKIEHMIQKSIEQATMIYIDNGFNEEPTYKCNNEGSLATWGPRFVTYFDTKEKIYEVIGQKMGSEDVNVRNFIIEYYRGIVFGDQSTKNKSLMYGIKRALKHFHKDVYENLDYLCNVVEDEETRETFGKEVEIARRHFEESEKNKIEDDIPF